MKRSRIKDMRHSLKNNGAEAAAKQKDPKQFSSRVCVCLLCSYVCVCACVGIFDVRPEVCYTRQQQHRESKHRTKSNCQTNTEKKPPPCKAAPLSTLASNAATPPCPLSCFPCCRRCHSSERLPWKNKQI